MHIVSPLTDNCSSWISGRGRMVVEMFSWPSLHERMCRTWGSNSGPLAFQADKLPSKLPRQVQGQWIVQSRSLSCTITVSDLCLSCFFSKGYLIYIQFGCHSSMCIDTRVKCQKMSWTNIKKKREKKMHVGCQIRNRGRVLVKSNKWRPLYAIFRNWIR